MIVPSNIEEKALPFPHCVVAPAFTPETADALLEILDAADWQRTTRSFYRLDVPSKKKDRHLVSDALRETIESSRQIQLLEDVIQRRLSLTFRTEIHRYSAGCGIGPHTDRDPCELRYVLSLNREWSPDDGGVWILSSDSSLREGRVLLPSLNNTGFMFQTAQNSFHALSNFHGNRIYALTLRIPFEQR
jgi:Rps23 Pro-64 3,4-dihydroxylase Tpa1-like proline 4-hydroxylase